MIEIKRDLNKIIDRHKSFTELAPVDRPLYCVNVIGRGYAAVYDATFGAIPKNREVRPEDIDINSYIKDTANFISWHEQAGADMFYPVVPFSYIPWMEAVAGCPIYAGKDSFYAEPFLKSADDIPDSIDLSEKNAWFAKLLEMSQALVSSFGEVYPMGSSTHLRGPADMMAAAIGQKQFPLELYDNPDKLKKLGKVCTRAFIEVARALNAIAAKAKFGGFIVNNFGIYTEEVCQYFQDDAVAFLSPKFYREFILEDHRTIDASFGQTLYHIHPISLFVAGELVSFANLKIIEINREPLAIGPSLEEMLPVFKKIQDSGKALVINFTDIDFSPELIEKEVRLACDNLAYEGLCIYICVENTKDGLRKTEAAKEVFKI